MVKRVRQEEKKAKRKNERFKGKKLWNKEEWENLGGGTEKEISERRW